jgi:hypothetical protein
LAPADFCLFPKLKSVRKEKHSSDVEDIKSSVKKMLKDISVQDLKIVLNNGRSTENIVKTWREITLKKLRLLICAALKKISLKTYFPTLYSHRTDCIKNTASHGSSFVACVFVPMGAYLPSH